MKYVRGKSTKYGFQTPNNIESEMKIRFKGKKFVFYVTSNPMYDSECWTITYEELN